MNAEEYPAYRDIVDTLRPVMHDLPARLIAIDGRPGVGKTTLGRYLAWRFNVTLLETDLFIVPNAGRLEYVEHEIDRIIQIRLAKPRPIIVEGVCILRLLARLAREPDFRIYISDPDAPEHLTFCDELSAYEAQFTPRDFADVIVNVSKTDC